MRRVNNVLRYAREKGFKVVKSKSYATIYMWKILDCWEIICPRCRLILATVCPPVIYRNEEMRIKEWLDVHECIQYKRLMRHRHKILWVVEGGKMLPRKYMKYRGIIPPFTSASIAPFPYARKGLKISMR